MTSRLVACKGIQSLHASRPSTKSRVTISRAGVPPGRQRPSTGTTACGARPVADSHIRLLQYVQAARYDVAQRRFADAGVGVCAGSAPRACLRNQAAGRRCERPNAACREQSRKHRTAVLEAVRDALWQAAPTKLQAALEVL